MQTLGVGYFTEGGGGGGGARSCVDMKRAGVLNGGNGVSH